MVLRPRLRNLWLISSSQSIAYKFSIPAELCIPNDLLFYHNTYVGFYLLDIAPVIGASAGLDRGPYPSQVNVSIIVRTRSA